MCNAHRDVVLLGGTFQEDPAAKFGVSFWCLPGGYDVMHSFALRVWFYDKESADYFVKKYKDCEQMAFPMYKEEEAVAA